MHNGGGVVMEQMMGDPHGAIEAGVIARGQTKEGVLIHPGISQNVQCHAGRQGQGATLADMP